MGTTLRFLILYLSIGSGHQSAANALKKGLHLIRPECRVFCEDLFTPALRDSVFPEFLSLSSTLFFPGVYDAAWQSGSMKTSYELLQSMPMLKNRVMELIAHRKPDIIVCTHSLPCSILADLRLEGTVFPPIVGVNTDFMAHPYWPVDGVEGYITATREAAQRLIQRGFVEQKIKVFGIPIDPVAEKLAEARLKNTLTEKGTERINVLILAGGKRLAPYVMIWPKTLSLLSEATRRSNHDIRWNVVCGKPSAFSQLLSDTAEGNENITLFNYVTDFLDLLGQQHYVITKPGGLILAESMALGVPAILVGKGSGQEGANAEIILANRGGILAETEKEILDYLEDVLAYPYIFDDAHRGALSLGKPAAARMAAEWILKGLPA